MTRFRWFAAVTCFVAATLPGQRVASSQAGSDRSPAAAPLVLIPRSHEERERGYLALHHIVLNVLAVDESGSPVTGLKPQDFVLMDNGRPQKVASFSEVNGDRGIAPPHVFLVLDAVNNTGRSIEFEVKQIDEFLRMNQGHLLYPTSIAILTRFGLRATGRSTDGSILLQESRDLFKDIPHYECDSLSDEATDALAPTGHGDDTIGVSIQKINDGNCLNDKFTLSLTSLYKLALKQTDVPGRVVVVWIGPGWPLLSGPEFHPDTAEIKTNFFDYVVQLSRTLREAQVTVDAVYSPDMFRKSELRGLPLRSFAEGPRRQEQATASDLALPAIATQSGGRVLMSKDLAAQITRCIGDLRSYYVLSFDYVPSATPDDYHSVHVTTRVPGVQILTNTLFYGEP